MIKGHGEQIARLIEAFSGARCHHAWLLAGPEGVGKRRVALAAAGWLLAKAAGHPFSATSFDLPEDHPTRRLIDAHSHPDFRLVEREVWDKGHRSDKLIPFAERKGDEDRARSIRIAQIRWLGSLMRVAPSLSDRRVILIDSADDLEVGAANALLKMLEEPPEGALFLLVSHAPDGLLPTIRSRCRMLRFGGLDDQAMNSLLRAQLPEADGAEIDALVRVGHGKPGVALRYAGMDVAGMDARIVEIARSGDRDNALRHQLATDLSAKAATERYAVFLTRVPAFLAEQAREAAASRLSPLLDGWSAARRLADGAIGQSLDPYMVVYSLASQIAALAPLRDGAKA